MVITGYIRRHTHTFPFGKMQRQPSETITTRTIGLLINMCRKLSIALADELDKTLKTVIVLCVRVQSCQDLHSAVIPEPFFVDWKSYVIQPEGDNLFGGCDVWIQMLSFMEFSRPGITDRELKNNYPPLYCIYNCVQGCPDKNAKKAANDTPDTLGFDDVCKLFILTNLRGLQCKTITDMYTTTRLKRDTSQLSGTILAALADDRHADSVYCDTFKFVFENMTAHTHRLASFVSHYMQAKAENQQVLVLKDRQRRGMARPSMRAVARQHASRVLTVTSGQLQYAPNDNGSTIAGADDDDGSMSTASSVFTKNTNTQSVIGRNATPQNVFTRGGAAESITYETFCDIVRFPVSLSRLLTYRCYLLCSMSHVLDLSKCASMLVTRHVADCLQGCPVYTPDYRDVCISISTLTLGGMNCLSCLYHSCTLLFHLLCARHFCNVCLTTFAQA